MRQDELLEKEADLQELHVIKEASDLLYDFCPGSEDASHWIVIHYTVKVPLPVSCLLHTVELLSLKKA